jgi:chondroitin AC lyase
MSLEAVYDKYTHLYSGYNGLNRSTTGRGVSTGDGYFRNILDTGEFSDINYDQRMDEVATRICVMVINYLERSSSSNYKLPSAKVKIENAINYYIAQRKENPTNWFYQWVAGPSAIMSSILKLRTKDSLGFPEEKLKQFSAAAPYYFSTMGEGTSKAFRDSDAANTVMFLDISMRKCLVEGNLSEFENNMVILKSYLRNMWVTEHGAKSDYSFHHHIGLMYLVGSYGMVYFRIFSEMMYCTEGTKWQFNTTEKDFLIDLMMKGLAYAQHRGTYDFAFKHKEWFKEFTITPSFHFIQNLKDIGHKISDINNFISYIKGESHIPDSIRNFYTSNIIVNKQNGWHQRVNYGSARQLRWTESFEPDKSIFGMYLGSTTTMVTGTETTNLLHLCEPNRLAGVTMRQFTLEETPYLNNKVTEGSIGGVNEMRSYPILHATGCNSNQFASVIYNFEGHFGITAKKLYFMTPVGMFCMGADINSDDSLYKQNIATAVEQKVVTGNTTVSINGREQNVTSEIMSNNFDWVWQGNVGYILPVSQSVSCSYLNKTGNINRILPLQSSKSAKGDVFSLWINHGNELNNKSYQYAVIPDISLSNFRNFENPFTVIQNDSLIQAVKYNNDVYTISFQDAGVVTLEDGISVSVVGPGLYIFEFNSDRTKLKINVSDPIGIADMKCEISMQLKGSEYIKHSNPKSTLLEFKANAGGEIGKALTINLTK